MTTVERSDDGVDLIISYDQGDVWCRRVRRVCDAEGAACDQCDTVFGGVGLVNPYWSWQKSRGLHQRGTGHTLTLFRVLRVVPTTKVEAA